MAQVLEIVTFAQLKATVAQIILQPVL